MKEWCSDARSGGGKDEAVGRLDRPKVAVRVETYWMLIAAQRPCLTKFSQPAQVRPEIADG